MRGAAGCAPTGDRREIEMSPEDPEDRRPEEVLSVDMSFAHCRQPGPMATCLASRDAMRAAACQPAPRLPPAAPESRGRACCAA